MWVWYRCFSGEFCEISKNTFFPEHLRWLFLKSKIMIMTMDRDIYFMYVSYKKWISINESKVKIENTKGP